MGDAAFRFASLTPTNAQAQQNFSAVAEKLQAQPATQYAHHRKFVHISPTQAPLLDPARSMTSESSDDGVLVKSPAAALLWSGYYIFSYNVLPAVARNGWAIGGGDRDIDPDTGLVDFLTDTSGGMLKRFAEFRFDHEGVFFLSARHTGVQMDGRPVKKYIHQTVASSTTLRFGSCDYRLDFEQPPAEEESAVQRRKNTFLAEAGITHHDPHPASSATPTPSHHEVTLGDWYIRAITGRTRQSTIKCAIRKIATETAACKTLPRHSVDQSRLIDEEIETYRDIHQKLLAKGPDSRGRQHVRRLRDVHYSSGHDTWRAGHDDEVTLFWMPFAHHTLSEFCYSEVAATPPRTVGTSDERKTWLTQLLFVLADFASMDYAHRDIKPGNIMICHHSDEESRYLSVIDLQQATVVPNGGKSPVPGSWGTKQYLAPEAENTAYSETYTTKVDVFSAGAVGYGLFVGRMPWTIPELNVFRWFPPPPQGSAAWGSSDTGRAVKRSRDAMTLYQMEMQRLAGFPADSIEHLLCQMLRDDPQQRITAEQALLHPSLAAAQREHAMDMVHSGQKRRRERTRT